MLSDVFDRWHAVLANDYRENGNVVSCGLLALAFAKLLSDDKRPYELKMLHNEERNEALRPVTYPEITWGGHVIVVSDGVVYDPIVSKPLPLSTYLTELFPNQDVLVRSVEPDLPESNPYLDPAVDIEI